MDKLKPREKAFLATVIFTGARRGEALALRWEDIDFEEGLVRIERAVTYSTKEGNEPVVGATKSRAGKRTVPLLPVLRGALENLGHGTGFVFNMGAPETPLTQSAFTRLWERIGKAIPVITENGYTCHQFRHAFATAAASNTDPKTLQTIMGHSDIRVTMDRYVHPRMDRIKEAGKAFSNMYADENASA